MSQRVAYLEAVVGADITQFRKGMRDVRNETGLLSEAMNGLSAVGRTMTFALTTPLVTLGSFAAEAAAGFDSGMRNINSIMHLSEDEYKSFSQEVLKAGGDMAQGPTAAAIGNAVARALGARIRDLPLTRERIMAALLA